MQGHGFRNGHAFSAQSSTDTFQHCVYRHPTRELTWLIVYRFTGLLHRERESIIEVFWVVVGGGDL